MDDGTIKVYNERVAAVFDGSTARILLGEDEGFNFGRITQRRDAVPNRMDPWDYFSNYSGLPVHDFFKLGKSSVTEETTSTGWKVLITETILDREPEFQRKYQFTIAPQRAFAPVRKASLVQFHESGKWHEYDTLEGADYVERFPGVWAPDVLHYRHHRVKGGVMGKDASEQWTARNENWVINANIPDSHFSLAFPVGVHVTDEINGLKYINTSIDDAMIDQLSREAEALRGQFETIPKVTLNRRSEVGTVATISALVLLASGFILWTTMRRSRKKA
jgi:hypothetical protein